MEIYTIEGLNFKIVRKEGALFEVHCNDNPIITGLTSIPHCKRFIKAYTNVAKSKKEGKKR